MLIRAAHYGCAGGNLASSVELRLSRYLISALERFRYLDPLENVMNRVTILMRTIIISIIQECTKRFAFNFSELCIGEQHRQAEPQTLVHITLGRKKDPFFLNIRNPIPQKVKRIPNIDPETPNCKRSTHGAACRKKPSSPAQAGMR